MKIALITLPNEGKVLDYTTAEYFKNPSIRYMPIGLLAVATSVADRHDVTVLDPFSKNLSIKETLEEIEKRNPDILGISAVTYRAYAMAEILKGANAPIKVVGGPHVTFYAKETLELGADAVFRGDGDRNFKTWIDEGCKSGKILEDYIEDINTIPLSRRDFLDIADYAISEDTAKDTLFKKAGARIPIFSSRGCPFHCIYCDVQGKKLRPLSPKRVVDSMENVLAMGATSVHILDDNFNVIKDRVLSICKEIKKRNLKFVWSARGRPKIDEETAKALVDAGCKRIHVGVESLDQKTLDWMHRETRVETMEEFFRICNKYEIETVAYFIIGAPTETPEYRKNLPNEIEKAGITYPYFNVLYPLANTKYYNMLLKDGTFEKDFWAEYAKSPTPNFVHPLPRPKELQEELMESVKAYINYFYPK